VNEVFDIAAECFDAVEIPVSTEIRYGNNVGRTILTPPTTTRPTHRTDAA